MGYQSTTLNELKPRDVVMRYNGMFNTIINVSSLYLIVYNHQSDKIEILPTLDFAYSVYKFVEQ